MMIRIDPPRDKASSSRQTAHTKNDPRRLYFRAMRITAALLFSIALSSPQVAPQQTTQAARPQRTEAEARARAEANRKQREEQRIKTGAPVELVHAYVKANVGPVPESLAVSTFYKKYPDAMTIPVIASEKVPDAALLVARDIVNSMLAA